MAPFIFAFLLCFGFIQAEVKGASPLQGFCQCNLELILDTSCSIPVSARPHILKFADELLNSNFKSAGVIKYDRYVQVVSTPTTTSSAKKALKQFADDLWCNRGEECCNTRTDKALKAAEEQVRSNNNGACNLVVLLTDGNTFPRDYKSYTVAAANSLKRVPDVTVVTVGVGQSIDPEELIAVATSKQHVILKDDFHLIQASDVCPPAATPSPSNAFGICGCDVEIVIDTSCSIPVSARDDILKFANELLDSNFKSAGIVAYDKYVRVISEQTTTSKAKSIIERLPDSFWCARGDDCCNTRTDKALTVVEDQVRKFSGGGCKTIILVTDGNTFPSSYKDDTISAANYIHRAHPDWTVITVGVGRSIDTSELAAIASGEGNKNVVLTADFHLLKAGDVCPSKPVILPPPIPQVPTPSRPPVVPPVEVPCQLSEWGAWSECSATCGSFGTRTSVRTIVKNGKDCGVTSRTEACNAIACPTPCESLAWGAWSECSKSCGVGIQQRTKGGAAASKGGVKGGSSPSCPVITETQACNTQPCVVDCVMSDWDSWTECSASCGGGRRQQTRTVQVQASNGGKQCGASIQFEACNTQACPVDCILGAWSQFTQCTVSCGGGNRQQSRPVVVAASAGGKQCESTSRSESCNTQACPIDCVMSEWTSFSECSVSCGNGKRQRSRSITVAPANGGKECGASVQVEACNTQACPVDCVMSSWTEWSECSASCGGGKKQRSRSIVVVPSAGGKACDVSVDVTGCGERPCPVDCVMSSWTGWSECSATCGGALQFRTRTIVTSPANGGADCQESSQVKTCADVPCPIPAPVPPRPVPVPVNPTQPTPSQGGFRPGEDNNNPVPTQPAPVPTQPVHVPTQPVPVPTQPAPVPTQPWGVPSWPSKGGSKGGGSKGGLKENNNSVNQFNAVPFLGGAVVGVVVVAVVVLVIAIVKKPTTRPIETSLNLL